MKSKIILLLSIIILLVSGCLSSKNIISESYDDINNKFVKECGNTLTTYQCDLWVENHINGNYVKWTGTIKDVNNGVVYISGLSPYGNSIGLYDISKEKIKSIKIGEEITFIGKINLKKHWLYKTYATEWISKSGVDLYNSDIITDNTVTETQQPEPQNKCLISETPPYPNGWSKEQVMEFNNKIKDRPCSVLD